MTFAKVFAILGLIAGILNVIGGFLALAGITAYSVKIWGKIPYANMLIYVSLGPFGIIWVSILISVVWTIPNIFLLVGISKKKPGFMMVWLVIKMILLVVS